MTAVARYELRSLLLTQRWVAPFLIYAAFLAILYAGPAGPGMTAFAITAFGLIPIGAFVTRALLHSEDDIARQVTVAAAGSPVRIQSAALLACAGLTAVLAVVAVAWGVVADSVHQLPVIAGGLAVHLLFGLFGIALGAVFSRPLVTPVGPAVLGIVAGTTLALGIPVSPVAWTIRNLIHHSAAGHLAGPSAAVLVLAVAGIGASVLAASR